MGERGGWDEKWERRVRRGREGKCKGKGRREGRNMEVREEGVEGAGKLGRREEEGRGK